MPMRPTLSAASHMAFARQVVARQPYWMQTNAVTVAVSVYGTCSVHGRNKEHCLLVGTGIW